MGSAVGRADQPDRSLAWAASRGRLCRVCQFSTRVPQERPIDQPVEHQTSALVLPLRIVRSGNGRDHGEPEVSVILPTSQPCPNPQSKWLRTKRGSSAPLNIPSRACGRCSNSYSRCLVCGLRRLRQRHDGSRPLGHRQRQGRRERTVGPDWRWPPFRARGSPDRCAIAAGMPAQSGHTNSRHGYRGD